MFVGNTTKQRTVRVFLSVRLVSYKRPADANPFHYRETRPMRYRSVWVTRGTTTDLYESKVCATKEEAVKLAHAWLARTNKPRPDLEALYACGHLPTVYVDTTENL